MAIYLKTAFKAESAVQNPEKLYREPLLMASFIATVFVLGILLFVRLPRLENFFTPTLPTNRTGESRRVMSCRFLTRTRYLPHDAISREVRTDLFTRRHASRCAAYPAS